MPYIKLLTVLTTLALLTACGGGTPADKAGGDTTDCTTNPFHADCNASDPAIITLRQSMCLADTTADPTCTGDAGIATVFCKDNPFNTSKACVADTGAIRQRQNQCLDNENISSTCGVVIAGVCMINPFQPTCLFDDTYLPDRIAVCITESEADGANCREITKNTTKNTTLTACLTNPFDVACESVPDFMSSFADARTNRASFCDNSDNATNDFCTGDNVTPICKFDQFTAICPDATYGTPRQEACLMDIMTNPKCTGEMGIATLFCEADPFNAETACGHGDYDDDRQTACLADIEEDPKCTGEMGIATLFCKDDPFHDSNACMADTYFPLRVSDCIKTENLGEARCNNLFTESAANTCLTSPFTASCKTNGEFGTYADMARKNRVSFCGISGNAGKAPCMGANVVGVCGSDPFNAICFTDTTYLPNRVADCITAGNAGETKCNNIFTASATNDCLTNPFTDACKMDDTFTNYLTDAQTKRLSFCVGATENTALCPMIVRTCIATPFANECTADVFRLARFNTCEERQDVVGCVNTGDLPTYPTKPNTEASTRFLTATETGLNITDIQFQGSTTRTILNPHFIGRRGLDSNNPDGFAYFVTTSTLNNSIGYVGILPTTNLGAPLPSTTANAVWAGHFSVSGTNNLATNYYVDFTNGKFGFSNAEEDGFGTFTRGNFVYTMNAVFGEHDDADGFNAGQMGGTLDVIDTGDAYSANIVGLIGEEGAVGVFTQPTGIAGNYTGGFTATNPAYITPE